MRCSTTKHAHTVRIYIYIYVYITVDAGSMIVDNPNRYYNNIYRIIYYIILCVSIRTHTAVMTKQDYLYLSRFG